MPLDTIAGKWTGEFKYDQGYPFAVQGKFVFFTMELWNKNNVINGIFIDDHTRHLNIGPATVIGTFEKNTIRFTKTYPYLLFLDENHKQPFSRAGRQSK